MLFLVHKRDAQLTGNIKLDGSKSISNRALLIRALCKDSFELQNLSTSDDTQTMLKLLSQADGPLDVGPAGTTFRFLTAYYATKDGDQLLTGSERMKQRPIGALVDALRSIGADIEYMENEGYPPLLIKTPRDLGRRRTIQIPANISSQFISALLMIAPTLPQGLEVQLVGDLVSASYLQMTLAMMQNFGIDYQYEDQKITIPAQAYVGADYQVESDWSAASYHYAMAALASDVDLTLQGLFPESMQGDAITPHLFTKLGLATEWLEDDTLRITKNDISLQAFEHDFILCPDIAQTIAVVAGALGVPAAFTGLETLSIKETDRIEALRTELAKVHVTFAKMPAKFSAKSGKTYHVIEGKARWESPPRFATYHDHRMAMSFAPLGIIRPVIIEDPAVVGKSYPDYWKDLTKLGWTIETME